MEQDILEILERFRKNVVDKLTPDAQEDFKAIVDYIVEILRLADSRFDEINEEKTKVEQLEDKLKKITNIINGDEYIEKD